VPATWERAWPGPAISIQSLRIHAQSGQPGAQITVKTGQAARTTATATAVGRGRHRRVVHLVVQRLNSSRYRISGHLPLTRPRWTVTVKAAISG
jgi:hypothetical protein